SALLLCYRPRFCLTATPTPPTHTLSLHDALPISRLGRAGRCAAPVQGKQAKGQAGHGDHDRNDGIGIHGTSSCHRPGVRDARRFLTLYPVSGAIATVWARHHRRPMRGVASVKPTSSLSPMDRLMAVPRATQLTGSGET